MKTKTICFIAILIIAVTIFINISSSNKQDENFNPLELNIGDVFTSIKYPNEMIVLNYVVGDINMDNEKEMIILVGEKTSENSFENVDVVVYETLNSSFINANLKKYNGSLSKIMLEDFNNDNVADIMIIMENENKEKNVRIVTLEKDGSLKEIMGAKENRGVTFVGEVIDGVKAHVKCTQFNKELYIDMIDMKNELLAGNKIDESGKILYENKKVETTGFTFVDIVEINGKKGIQTKQILYAFDKSEIIDEITTIWLFENGKWQIKEAKGNKIENLVY